MKQLDNNGDTVLNIETFNFLSNSAIMKLLLFSTWRLEKIIFFNFRIL